MIIMNMIDYILFQIKVYSQKNTPTIVPNAYAITLTAFLFQANIFFIDSFFYRYKILSHYFFTKNIMLFTYVVLYIIVTVYFYNIKKINKINAEEKIKEAPLKLRFFSIIYVLSTIAAIVWSIVVAKN